MAKVLVVTNAQGYLNITPLKNKAYYQQRNNLSRKKMQQYKFVEMEGGYIGNDGKFIDGEAEKYVKKNKSRDPSWVPASQAHTVIGTQAQQIEDQSKEMERMKQELEELKKMKQPQPKKVD